MRHLCRSSLAVTREQPREPQDVWRHTSETASPWLVGYLAPPLWPREPQRPQRLEQGSENGLTLARSGGWCNPPWVFLSWTPHRLEDRAEIFHSLWGILCGTFGEKNLVGSGQVTKLWSHKRNNLRKISAKSWVNATWRGAIDLHGDSWWDWCQYMTGCDPWHCARWGSRSNKVTWGHWPRLNSQWQITNRHMFSGGPWGAESESVVHCP